MILAVKIQPNARVSEFIGWEAEHLKIKLKAPPVDGKANEELIRFIAKEFKLTKSSVTIKSGHTSKIKLLNLSDAAIWPAGLSRK